MNVDPPTLFDLSDRAKITLIGPEAQMLLHNLSTQEVKGMAAGSGGEAFLCTAKARVVGHIFISHLPSPQGSFLLVDADAGQQARLLQHLNHFLISEQVDIADATADWGLLRLAGSSAPKVLQAAFPQAGGDLDLWKMRDLGAGVWIRRHDLLALPTFDMFCPPHTTASLWDALLCAGAIAGDEPTHETMRIEAGLPRIGLDMDESRFVVETGRIAQAISYTKGCYLGQEPIVMARDRGQINRKSMGVTFGDGPLPRPGTKLYRGTEEVGLVTSTVQSPRLGPIGLAYLRRGCQEPGTALTMDPSPDSRQAFLASLPFGSAGGPGTSSAT